MEKNDERRGGESSGKVSCGGKKIAGRGAHDYDATSIGKKRVSMKDFLVRSRETRKSVGNICEMRVGGKKKLTHDALFSVKN